MGMLREERIPDAQLLPIGWIIPEDAQIILRRAEMLLPPELVLDIVPREFPEPRKFPVNNNPGPPSVTVEVPGYSRVTEGYSQRQIYEKTGVHPVTQRKVRDGGKVNPAVVWRLARGFGIDTDELLRRG